MTVFACGCCYWTGFYQPVLKPQRYLLLCLTILSWRHGTCGKVAERPKRFLGSRSTKASLQSPRIGAAQFGALRSGGRRHDVYSVASADPTQTHQKFSIARSQMQNSPQDPLQNPQSTPLMRVPTGLTLARNVGKVGKGAAYRAS